MILILKESFWILNVIENISSGKYDNQRYVGSNDWIQSEWFTAKTEEISSVAHSLPFHSCLVYQVEGMCLFDHSVLAI